MKWHQIPGWFQWRSGQEEAVSWFPQGSRFVEVGNYLGRSLCSLGEVASASGKQFSIIGIDTCRGSGVEGPRQQDYQGDAVREGGGTFAGTLHKNVIACGYDGLISLVVSDSVSASTLFADGSLEWVHLDARHDHDHLKADIEAWLPKVKVNGWLSGDDYDSVKWPEVVTTVRELLPHAHGWSTNQWRWTRAAETSVAEASPCEQHARVEPTVVCTLGMHRSGTSVVSRLLNLLGVDLGSDAHLAARGADNPKGYWEHGAFVEINDKILETFGGRWDRPPTLPCNWLRAPELEPLRQRARQLLQDEFSTAEMWGWKDPRTSLTLPFWQELIGPMRYVIPVRNPLAVVASLMRRDDMQPCDAEWLWLKHTQAIVGGTTGHPRLFVFQEDLMDEPSVGLHRMAAFLGVPDRADDISVQIEVSGFIEQSLCHHRSTMGQLAGEASTSFPAKSLYLALRAFARVDGCQDESVRVAHEPTRAEQALSWIATLSLDAWTDRKRQTIREEELRQATAHLQSTLATTVIERDGLARRTADASQELSEIYTSAAWRLVTDNRARLERILPQGTRRRRVFHAGLQRLTSRNGRRS